MNRHRGAEVLRIAVVDLPDLSTLLSRADGLLTELALPGGRSLDLLRLPAMGWGQTAETLEGLPERADVVLTSATGEIDHARHDSREDLLRLVGAVAELRSRLIVANVSTIACSEPGRPADKATRLEARRLNLLIMEVSASTGLAVLDVDRIAAETITSPKTTGRFTYGEAVSRSLRAGLLGVLGGLGLTARSTFALRTPFVRQASDLRVERWAVATGDRVQPGDTLCELRLGGLRRMTRPTNAIVLGSIKGGVPLARRIVRRERVKRRQADAVLPIVADEAAIVRRILLPEGTDVRAGDALALLTDDDAVPLALSPADAATFRASIRTDDPMIEVLL